MSTPATQNKTRLLLLLSIAALLFGFGLYLKRLDLVGEMPSRAPLEPAGRQAWTEVVAAGAGMEIEPEELEALAEGLLVEIEDRLADLARRAGQGSDWRAIYHSLQAEHPDDGPALLEAYRSEIERSRTFLSELKIVPLPTRRVEVVEAANPAILEAFSMAFYIDGRLGVVIGSEDGGADDELHIHCYVCIPPLVVHETYPGHHVAFSSTGQKRLSGDPADYYFHEGWALYGELLMLEAGYYETIEGEIAAWRLLLLRTLRALIDPRLHRGELDRSAAANLYRDRLMLSERAAETEIRGHLLKPGIKASYLIGLLQVLEIRKQSQKLSDPPSLLDLHRRLLREAGPWPAIAKRELGIEIVGLKPPALPPCSQVGS